MGLLEWTLEDNLKLDEEIETRGKIIRKESEELDDLIDKKVANMIVINALKSKREVLEDGTIITTFDWNS